jgi:hypothetical protein
MSRSDDATDERERIRQFLSKPPSRRHPDMLLPNDDPDDE